MAERAPATRAETLAGLAEARRRLLDAVARAGWSHATADGWTAKDHLAHVVAWQRRLLAWFAEDAANRTPARPEPGYTFDQIDELNARDRAASRDRPADAVLADFEAAHAEIVRLVESLDDDDLTADDRFAWLGFPASHTIAGNSWGHYLEHAEMIDRAD